MSTTGTIEPRRLKIPIKKLGARGTRVSGGHSTTSSTSNTEKQKRSRPERKTQYCRSGSASGCAKSSICCASADIGSSCFCSSGILIYIYKDSVLREIPLPLFAQIAARVVPTQRARDFGSGLTPAKRLKLFLFVRQPYLHHASLFRGLLGFLFLHQIAHRAQQLFIAEWLGYVAVGALLFSPEPIALAALRADDDHWNLGIDSVAFQLPAS